MRNRPFFISWAKVDNATLRTAQTEPGAVDGDLQIPRSIESCLIVSMHVPPAPSGTVDFRTRGDLRDINNSSPTAAPSPVIEQDHGEVTPRGCRDGTRRTPAITGDGSQRRLLGPHSPESLASRSYPHRTSFPVGRSRPMDRPT